MFWNPSKYLFYLIILLLFCYVNFVVSNLVIESNSEQIQSLFQTWTEKFKKNYSTLQQYQTAFTNFKDNLKRIEKFKAESMKRNSSYVPGLTKFADMSPQEFNSKILMPKRNIKLDEPCTVPGGARAKDLPITDLPDSFDWREKGAVTPVKDQGSVGTCWAFSTTGNIEGQWFLKSNQLISLSEEQLNDCDGYDCGVFGGYPCRAYQYIIKAGGLMSEKDYSYCVGSGDCFPCSPPGYNETFCGPGPEYCNGTAWPCRAYPAKSAVKISSWQAFGTNETQIMAQLVANGPLSVLMDASGFPPLQYHEWGIYNPWSCDPTALDHAVLLVGYGTDGSTPYWIVKNSWGTDWSDEGGYFRIARGGVCGINQAVTSAKI